MKRKNQEAQKLEVDYLSRLKDSLRGIPDRDVEEIIQEVHRHIEDAIAELPDEEVTLSQMAGVLEILGPPESFAEKNSAEGTSPLPTIDNDKYKLPVFATLYKAFITIADNSLISFKALLLPSIIMILVSIGQEQMRQHVMALENNRSVHAFYMMITTLSTSIIIGILAAMFAVICHRVILLGKESVPNSLGLYLSSREMKYFGWVFLFGIPIGIGYMAAPIMIPLFMKSIDDPRNILLLFSQVWGIAGLVIVSFITAPFILVLPATAVEEKRTFNKARSTVKGNILRLAIVLLIPALITLLIRLVLRRFGPEASNILYDVFTGLIYLVFLLFQTVVLSISYKTLSYDR